MKRAMIILSLLTFACGAPVVPITPPVIGETVPESHYRRRPYVVLVVPAPTPTQVTGGKNKIP